MFYGEDQRNVLFTFKEGFQEQTSMAGALACTATLARIELLCSQGIQEIQTREKVGIIRQYVTVSALELKLHPECHCNLRGKPFRYFIDKGVFLRPLGNTINILAFYDILDQQEEKGLQYYSRRFE